MKTSENGLNLIKEFEGFSAQPYLCPAGKMTVGYGHVLKHGELCDQITPADATKLLAEDVAKAEQAVNSLVTVELTQNEFDALVDFVYNLGSGAFANSTLLVLLNDEEYDLAADQFLRWNHIGKEVSDGLTRRREAERKLFMDYA